MGEAGGDGGGGETAGRDEDFTATTEVVVQRINDESATVLVSNCSLKLVVVDRLTSNQQSRR